MDGEKVYRTGREFFRYAQYEAALTCFKQAAIEQYPGSYLWLGYFHQINSLVGPKDLEISGRWYSKMREQLNWFKDQAEAGRPDIQADLGLYYESHRSDSNFQQAVKYYRLATEKGEVFAQCNLGGCYHYGRGVEKDLQQAVKYYRLAARQGNVRAQCNLGFCYHHGRGIEKDLRKALHYYRLAAERGDGDARAQRNLGICYEMGFGVNKNLQHALHYYSLAVEQNDIAAKIRLEILLNTHSYLKTTYLDDVLAENFFDIKDVSFSF